MTSNNVTYKNKIYTNNGNKALCELIASGNSCILDIGCGNGANMEILIAKGHQVEGITISEAEFTICKNKELDVKILDITTDLHLLNAPYDSIILSHVLEHLVDPDLTLRQIKTILKPNGIIYAALPNVLYINQRIKFLFGKWRYTETGIMDRTHLRFFDHESARDLFLKAGYEIIHHTADGAVPQSVFRKLFPIFSKKVDVLGTRMFPGLFGFQHIIVAKISSNALTY